MLLQDEYTLGNIKTYLKKLALYIRISKQLRKTVYCNLDSFNEKDIEYVKNSNWWVGEYSYEFRHYHIAYCLYRGRMMNEIENGKEDVPYKAKKILDEIQTVMEVYNDAREKNVCTS